MFSSNKECQRAFFGQKAKVFVPYKPLHPRPIFATEATAYLSGATMSKRAMSFRRKAFVRQIFSLHNFFAKTVLYVSTK